MLNHSTRRFTGARTRTPLRASFAVLALTGGSLLGVVPPAHAADPVVLHVRQQSTTCSDSGPGTVQQPFCTIGAAAAVVAEGQTVEIGGGNYRERVTIATSGVTFQAALAAGPTVIGDTAGFVIDGQHDVTLRAIRVVAAAGAQTPALEVRDSAGINIVNGTFAMADPPSAVPAVRLTGVTGALLAPALVAGEVTIDATSSAVTISKTQFRGSTIDPGHAVGIRISGRGHKVLNTMIGGYASTAVAVEPDAVDTVVANNQILSGLGVGIHDRGATGTAITNNTVRDRCGDGVRVDGASGASVQNNLVYRNGGSGLDSCPDTGAEIRVNDGPVARTVVDYNNASHAATTSPRLYAWNDTPMSLAAFRAATGQARHDIETGLLATTIDSANSAAPGFQSTDRLGLARIDDLGVPDTGAGPVRYADRGAAETYSGPKAHATFTLDLVARSVTVNASTSVPGTAPIASYRFDFGDGTIVNQTSPVATHRYATSGTYPISLLATDTQDRTAATAAETVDVLRSTATVGLLSLFNLRYVAPVAAGTALAPSQAALTADGRVDLADAGSGQVALMLRGTGKYLSVNPSSSPATLTWTKTQVHDTERWILVRNADGSLSFQSRATGGYISLESAATPHLLVKQSTAMSSWEKFHQVRVSDTDRTLRARANGKLVVAESAGAKPLIANRTAVGVWERFDLVDLGNGQVALLARANNRFVVAESAGAKQLIANRVAVGAWERYTLIRNSDGTVSLRAAINNRYVVAENAGAKPLIANRVAIGPWEKFILG